MEINEFIKHYMVTSSANDFVSTLENSSLLDYNSILLISDRHVASVSSDCFIKEKKEALENLAKDALAENCSFVSDLQVVINSSLGTVGYIGTGYVKKES